MLSACVDVTLKVMIINIVQNFNLIFTSKNTHRGAYEFHVIYSEDGD
jgi:hypothetical protein